VNPLPVSSYPPPSSRTPHLGHQILTSTSERDGPVSLFPSVHFGLQRLEPTAERVQPSGWAVLECIVEILTVDGEVKRDIRVGRGGRQRRLEVEGDTFEGEGKGVRLAGTGRVSPVVVCRRQTHSCGPVSLVPTSKPRNSRKTPFPAFHERADLGLPLSVLSSLQRFSSRSAYSHRSPTPAPCRSRTTASSKSPCGRSH
jgi:hypothetical protein